MIAPTPDAVLLDANHLDGQRIRRRTSIAGRLEPRPSAATNLRALRRRLYRPQAAIACLVRANANAEKIYIEDKHIFLQATLLLNPPGTGAILWAGPTSPSHRISSGQSTHPN